MVPNLAVLNEYLYAKIEFLTCSSTIKQVCLPVWEAAFFTFESSVLVGGFIPLAKGRVCELIQIVIKIRR